MPASGTWASRCRWRSSPTTRRRARTMAEDPPSSQGARRAGEPLAGEALLESLGYRQELRRRLSFWNNVGLTLADITPMGSLLIIGTVVIATAGTGSILSYRLGGFIAMLDYIGQAIFLPASIAIGVGTYVTSLWSAAPSNWSAAIVMAGVTVIALFDIKFNAWFTATFLALQLIVLGLLFVAGVSSIDQPFSIVTHPVVAGVAIAFEVVPFIAAVFGADNLQSFLSSDTPLTDVIGSTFGTGFNDVVTVVAILAFLNASLAITLQFARITWSSGRDRAWPGPLSETLDAVSRQGTPWVATLIVGACATVLCIRSSLLTVVTFTAVLIIVLYALIAISALVSRARRPDLPRPYRMPLWPVPPLIALGGVVVALTQQKLRDLLVVGGLFVVGFLYFMLFIRPREDRYWTMTTDPEAELQRLASHG